MSYSFSVMANSKAEVRALVEKKFDEVVQSQPTHAADRSAMLETVEAFTNILREPGEGEGISVSVSGSLSWQYGQENVFSAVGFNVGVGIAPIQKPSST